MALPNEKNVDTVMGEVLCYETHTHIMYIYMHVAYAHTLSLSVPLSLSLSLYLSHNFIQLTKPFRR